MAPPAYCIYLQYTDRHQADGLMRLRKIAPTLFPHHQLRYLIVDNAIENDFELQVSSDCDRIGGDNRVREFTGYQKGLEWIAGRHPVDDLTPVLFANDTFFRSYGDSYLTWFRPAVVESALRDRAILGYIDAFPQDVQLGALNLREWIRTSFFVLPFATALQLRPFAVELKDEDLFSEDEAFFKNPSPLSENYRDYLRTWLFGESRRPEFTQRWHSSALLEASNTRSMQVKTLCILSEHSLSARASAEGIPLQAVRPRLFDRALRRAFGLSKNALKDLLRKRSRLG